MKRNILLIFIFFNLQAALYAQVLPALKITPNTRNVWDNFGTAVAIDGPYAVIGSPNNDAGGSDAGIAHIFERNANGNWEEMQTLLPTDLRPGDNFGYYTAISGNFVAVSAPSADSVGTDSIVKNVGAVYIFERNSAGVWQQVKKIIVPDAHKDDGLGEVALSGKYLVAGSFSDYDAAGTNYKNGAGAAYVFERTDAGQWIPVQKLTASDRSEFDSFSRVAVDAYTRTIVIGAIGAKIVSGGTTVPYAGAAYVFKRDISGSWNEVKKLTAAVPRHSGAFGWSVDVSGDWIAVSAVREHYNENEVYNSEIAGVVYLFENNGGAWTQMRKLAAHDGNQNDEYGRSVSLDGNYVVIGSEGRTNENGQDHLIYAGSAYLYERIGSNWSLKKKLLAPDRSIYDQFGWSVSLAGGQVMIGAAQEGPDPNGANSMSYGAAYIFNIVNPLEVAENELFSVDVYPNPTEGELSISGKEVLTELVLTDVTGKILNQAFPSQSGVISYTINQPEGIYFLKITDGKSTVIKKILVR